MNLNFKKNVGTKSRGFTLVETVVGVTVFLIVALAAYQAYLGLFKVIAHNDQNTLAISLANEQFEMIRNLPYGSVGIVSGIPSGIIPHVQTFVRGGTTFVATTTVRNIDLPFDGTIGGSPNDTAPADNKAVQIEVGCPLCKNFKPIILTTNIAPKYVEGMSANQGALFVKVFDENGYPVPQAPVHVENNSVTPHIVVDDVTNNSGMLQIIGVPTGTQVYEITVTKSGYSTAQTYKPGGVAGATPVQPHASVVDQQVTPISFAIDKLSTLHISSMNSSCAPVPNIDFSLLGAKIIGTGVLKFSKNLATDASGSYINPSIEFDSYVLSNLDSAYDIVGLNPLNPTVLHANSSQDISLIVLPKNPKTLVVTVKDSANLPISGATVTLTGGSYNSTKTTGRGYISQTDWSGGAGQTDFSNETKYFGDNGNIDTSGGELKLRKVLGSYLSSGVLESSTIDAGVSTNFYNLIWNPQGTSPQTELNSVRFQIATNGTSTDPWIYRGPDGATTTYYTSSNSTIAPVHNGDRYLRYKVFINTADPAYTPNISDVSLVFTTACTPSGQVSFSGLSSGNYNVQVSKSGYTSSSATVNMSSGWQEKYVTLTP